MLLPLQDIPRGHPDAFTGKTFVFSGVLPALWRDAAKELIASHGGRVTGDVSGKTSFLVLGAAGSRRKYDKVCAGIGSEVKQQGQGKGGLCGHVVWLLRLGGPVKGRTGLRIDCYLNSAGVFVGVVPSPLKTNMLWPCLASCGLTGGLYSTWHTIPASRVPAFALTLLPHTLRHHHPCPFIPAMAGHRQCWQGVPGD
jgi:hypothetical protein